jgi:hypothetical protein
MFDVWVLSCVLRILLNGGYHTNFLATRVCLAFLATLTVGLAAATLALGAAALAFGFAASFLGAAAGLGAVFAASLADILVPTTSLVEEQEKGRGLRAHGNWVRKIWAKISVVL